MTAAAGRGPVLVTGGTSGIGLGVAQAVVQRGRPVVVLGRNPERAQAAAVSLRGTTAGSKVVALPGDTTDPDVLAAAVGTALDRWGRLDGLVTAAGRLARGALLDLTPEEFTAVWQTNVHGTWLALRACVPPMMQQEHGRIVTIGSVLAPPALRPARGTPRPRAPSRHSPAPSRWSWPGPASQSTASHPGRYARR